MSWGGKKEALVAKRPEDYFKPLTKQPITSLKIAVDGPPESGKTYFCESAPEPVYLIDTHAGAWLVRRHFPDDKDIRIMDLSDLSPDTEPIQYIEYIENAVDTLRDINQGTICIDSLSDIQAWLGAWLEDVATRRLKSGDVARFEWGKANARFRQMMMKLISKKDVHLIMTSEVTNEYTSEGKELSTTRPTWPRRTPYWLDIWMRLTLEFDPVTKQNRHIAIVEKCRAQWALNLRIENVTFDKLVQQLREKLKLEVKI